MMRGCLPLEAKAPLKSQAREIDMTKVPEQKGKIKCDMPTLRTMTYTERVKDREAEVMARRDGQTLKFHTPKK